MSDGLLRQSSLMESVQGGARLFSPHESPLPSALSGNQIYALTIEYNHTLVTKYLHGVPRFERVAQQVAAIWPVQFPPANYAAPDPFTAVEWFYAGLEGYNTNFQLFTITGDPPVLNYYTIGDFKFVDWYVSYPEDPPYWPEDVMNLKWSASYAWPPSSMSATRFTWEDGGLYGGQPDVYCNALGLADYAAEYAWALERTEALTWPGSWSQYNTVTFNEPPPNEVNEQTYPPGTYTRENVVGTSSGTLDITEGVLGNTVDCQLGWKLFYLVPNPPFADKPSTNRVDIFRGRCRYTGSPAELYWVGRYRACVPFDYAWNLDTTRDADKKIPIYQLEIIRTGFVEEGQSVGWKCDKPVDPPDREPFPLRSLTLDASNAIVADVVFVVIGKDPMSWAAEHGMHFGIRWTKYTGGTWTWGTDPIADLGTANNTVQTDSNAVFTDEP